MHTAKGTRQVPKRWEMVSEQLGENLLLHVTPKHEKAAAPKSAGGGVAEIL